MMTFRCTYQWDKDERDDWFGTIRSIENYGNHYEVFIVSRSSLRVIVGKSTSGFFACIPDEQVGCHLSTLDDTFYNSEKLIYALTNPVDGTTVACALHALSNILKFK